VIPSIFLNTIPFLKNAIPPNSTTNYEPLLDLVGLLGVNMKDRMSIAKDVTYMSDKTIQEIIFIISETIKILNEIKRSEHFALMFNDCTTTEQLAIHG